MQLIPVLVTWVDAHADATGWTAVDDLERTPRIISSCGLLLPGVKDEHVSLAQSVDGDLVDSVLHVPESAILATVYLDRRR